jgi:hypothetical protein
LALRTSLTYQEFLNLTPRQIQRLTYAVHKADYEKQGGDPVKYKDPINTSDQVLESKDKKAEDLLNFFENNQGNLSTVIKSSKV